MQKQQIINFFAWTFVSIVGLLVGTVVLVMVLGVLAMHPYIGFLPESQFRLAPESRLPNWFNLAKKYKREDLDVEIYYYTPPFGKTNFIAYLIGPPPERKKLIICCFCMRCSQNYRHQKTSVSIFPIDQQCHRD